MQDVGEAWLMTSMTKSPILISLLQTAESLPIFFLALPAGAFADIMDRRRLLIFAQIWMLTAATGAAFFFNAVSFLVIALVLYRWHRPPYESVLPSERTMGAIRAGLS